MSDDAGAAPDLVARWLQLDPDDPARHDARDVVDAIGREAQGESARVAAALHAPLGDSTAHASDASEIAQTLADLRRELDALDPSELSARPSWLGRTLARIPGVGTASTRYAQRLASSQPRINDIVSALDVGRGVLSRDNVTLRSDQERLHELSSSLCGDLYIAQDFDDALVFAIDVELPFGDLRRPFFEDDLLVAVRRRLRDLQHSLETNQQGLAAIEVVMDQHRQLIRGIDHTSELTISALRIAASSAASASLDARVAEQIGTGPNGLTISQDALRSALDDIDRALNSVTVQRKEASAKMERTVRQIAASESGAATTPVKHEETT